MQGKIHEKYRQSNSRYRHLYRQFVWLWANSGELECTEDSARSVFIAAKYLNLNSYVYADERR